eukprot:9971_1
MSTKRLVSLYRKLRAFKYRNELLEDQNMHIHNDYIVRVMSYNILADGESYALGKWFDYCPSGKNGDRLAFRKWSYRGPRILTQIECYLPDIICLQETTHHTFNAYFEPKLKALGYHGIHGIRDTIAAQNGNLNHMTDALFYNTNKFKLMDHKILRINQIANTKYFGDYTNGYPYLNKLFNRMDICIVTYLQFIKTRKPLIALNSHLLWDDAYAHTRLAQCFIINQELHHVLTNKWQLNPQEVSIIFGTDANCNVMKSPFEVFYDEMKPTVNGVYQLMTTSKVNKEHIDHPYTRCKLQFDFHNSNAKTNGHKTKSSVGHDRFVIKMVGLPGNAQESVVRQFFRDENIAEIAMLNNAVGECLVEFVDEKSSISGMMKNRSIIGGQHTIQLCVSNEHEFDVATGRIKREFVNPDVDDWMIDMQWKSAYKEACGHEPYFTCKLPDYCGVSDYIFTSKNCTACSYLELPYHHVESSAEIPNIPNEIDPSDHIPIVCDVNVCDVNVCDVNVSKL